jgi:arylsulfatase A-like enzyme
VAWMVLGCRHMTFARRRALAASLAILTLAGTAAVFALAVRHSPRRTARNVVIVCIDTLRADHLSAYGYRRATTPRLDALARRGELFEHASSTAPWTVPSVGSLLTSLYPGEHGAAVQGEVRQLDEQSPAQLRPEVETLGDILHAAGFRTALLSANPYLWGRFQRGFDTAVADHQSAGELTDRAIAWLRRRPRKPFFLYLQYMDLHQPIAPPPAYAGHFPVSLGGERGAEHADWSFDRQSDLADPEFRRFRAHKIALYDGALLYVDTEIGRLLDALARLGRRDDTLVVVAADHGEEFWDHAEAERQMGGDPRGVWGIGHGHTLYQELLHVPLIVAGPGWDGGRRVPCGVSLLDVAPTVLASLGLPPRPAMRGASLHRFLRAADGAGGDDPGACAPAAVAAESTAYGPDARSLVWSGWKLIERDGTGPTLYDLGADPGERHDLAGCRPRTLAALSGLLAHELAPRGRPGDMAPLAPTAPDAETSRQLRSLGYLGGGG